MLDCNIGQPEHDALLHLHHGMCCTQYLDNVQPHNNPSPMKDLLLLQLVSILLRVSLKLFLMTKHSTLSFLWSAPQ